MGTQSQLDRLDDQTEAQLGVGAGGMGGRGGKQRYTVQLSRSLIEKLRDAVYWTPGLTLAGLAEQALREAVDELEADRGEVFPKRPGELKAGRPVGS